MEPDINMAPCLAFSFGDDGNIMEVNQRLCLKLGYEREELVGKKTDVLFTVPTRIFHQTHFFPLLKMQGHAEEIYATLLQKNGEVIPVLINAQAYSDKERTLFVCAGIIVHNRKKFEDELVAARKEAQKALQESTALLQAKTEIQKHAELLDEKIFQVKNQNTELKQFNRVVTHDLQEPLRKLLVFINMLSEGNDPDIQKKTLPKLKNVTEQLRSILSGLQQYMWLTDSAFRLTHVDLDKLVLMAERDIKKERAGIDISVQKSNLPPIMADRDQLQFLLKEIFSNAVHFRREETGVVIQVTATTLLQNKFKSVSHKYKYTEYLKVDISDNGIGFEDDYQDQAFELFKRLHPSGGRGVGLALCRKIMENHLGSISISGNKSKGTTVSLFFPLLKADPLAEGKQENPVMENDVKE